VPAGTRSDLAKPLNRLADSISRRGLVVVVSDLLDDPDAVLAGLKHLRFRGMEVVVFHVFDPAERTFPFSQATRFRDLETGAEVVTAPAVVREAYLKRFEEERVRFEQGMRGQGVDYCRLETSTPLEFALLAYFAARRRALV